MERGRLGTDSVAIVVLTFKAINKFNFLFVYIVWLKTTIVFYYNG